MPFKKGQSGNPGGRPKEIEEIKKLAQGFGPGAMKRLIHWAKSNDSRASIAACQTIIDRGYGKAVQALEHTGPNGGPVEHRIGPDLSKLTDAQLAALESIVSVTGPADDQSGEGET